MIIGKSYSLNTIKILPGKSRYENILKLEANNSYLIILDGIIRNPNIDIKKFKSMIKFKANYIYIKQNYLLNFKISNNNLRISVERNVEYIINIKTYLL